VYKTQHTAAEDTNEADKVIIDYHTNMSLHNKNKLMWVKTTVNLIKQ